MMRRAAAEHDAGRHQGEGGRGGDQHRLEHLAELRDAEVELDLEHRQPTRMPPKPRYWMNLMKMPPVGASSPIALSPSWLSMIADQRGEARAADHHQVGRTPQRDVLAEDAVPDVVEREAGQRVQAAAGHQDAADGRVPVAGDAHGGRTGLVVRQHARQAARDEQQEQAEQDEVVRGIGQRVPGRGPCRCAG